MGLSALGRPAVVLFADPKQAARAMMAEAAASAGGGESEQNMRGRASAPNEGAVFERKRGRKRKLCGLLLAYITIEALAFGVKAGGVSGKFPGSSSRSKGVRAWGISKAAPRTHACVRAYATSPLLSCFYPPSLSTFQATAMLERSNHVGKKYGVLVVYTSGVTVLPFEISRLCPTKPVVFVSFCVLQGANAAVV